MSPVAPVTRIFPGVLDFWAGSGGVVTTPYLQEPAYYADRGWNTGRVVPTPQDLESSVVWSVIRAAHVLEREVTALFAGFDLSPVQFGVVSYLGANGPMTTAALARSVLVRPQSLTGVVTSLEGRGIVERPGVRARGRANPVALTAAGGQLLAEVWPAFAAADEATARDLDTQQSAALTATLHRLLTARPGN